MLSDPGLSEGSGGVVGLSGVGTTSLFALCFFTNAPAPTGWAKDVGLY